jgi:hypothetical protein
MVSNKTFDLSEVSSLQTCIPCVCSCVCTKWILLKFNAGVAACRWAGITNRFISLELIKQVHIKKQRWAIDFLTLQFSSGAQMQRAMASPPK